MLTPARKIFGSRLTWSLGFVLILAAATPVSAQYELGGYGGFGGYGYSGLGGYGGYGGIGYNGYGGGFGGYPFASSLNAYNLGYGNTLGIGLVPPAYVGTGTAGLGPTGIGGINPLFGLGLSPLAIQNAMAEQSLRQRGAQPGGPPRGIPGTSYRIKLTDLNSVPTTVPVAPR